MEQGTLESLADTEENRTAMRTVLARADEHGTVEWADVRGALTGEQWGRLIGSGVLIDAGPQGGFVIDDPDALRTILGTDRPDETVGASKGASPEGDRGNGRIAEVESGIDTTDEAGEPADAPNWTRYDKLAAVAAVGLMGFEMTGNRTVIGHLVNTIVGPLETLLPFYVIVIVLAIALGVYSTLLQSRLMDYEFIGKRQQRMTELQERRQAAKEREDEDALERIQDEQMEAMGGQLDMFKAQFRPMVWIVLLTIPAYLWMYWMVQGHVPAAETTVVLPLVGRASLTAAVLGPIQAWLVWYFLCSMASRQVIRKALGVRTNPSAAAADA